MNHLKMPGNKFAAIGAMLLMLPPRLPAQPPQPADGTTALRQQIETMQRALKAMQERLDAIEAGRVAEPPPTVPSSNTPPTPPLPKPPPVRPEIDPGAGANATASGVVLTPQVAENWSLLREGMSAEQVKALLGDPSRDFRLSGQTVWYYYYTGVGGGSVMFSRGERTLSDWQRPPFHGWW